jgi:Fe-S oxidoreductase
MRRAMVDLGYRVQAGAARLTRPVSRRAVVERPASTNGKARTGSQIVHFVSRPLPRAQENRTMRALLGVEDRRYIPMIEPGAARDSNGAVFYFPGCGSERLFSEIGLATLALLHHSNTRTILPPGYLCCGYPQKSSGDERRGHQITTDNRVLFHRVANTLSYLDIHTVVVSCGTCMDQMLEYEFDKIFPGCRLLDIHEFLMERGVSIDKVPGVQYVYHEPCHSPMKTHDSMTVGSTLLGQEVTLSDRCCGEAGTFAVARADIATQVRYSKEKVLLENIEEARSAEGASHDEVRLLTSCPSCKQGLSRYRDSTGMEPEYIVEALARGLLGDDWKNDFVSALRKEGIERVML